ncbi:VOC family protein [Novosphingobium sp. G106]|uniref:VOC family protein n=1 Tax=Novosphingobium sp. G106 TaxID=2849500 RepID=UPI001C2D432E|nr:VOC family protein [Novosphingobium sp. G106]MBV1688973.1 VOC family protein [Novosphingobium sp. G106]
MNRILATVPHYLSKSEPYQLGVVVRDLAQSMAAYGEIFGISQWRETAINYRARFRDEIGQVVKRNAFARLGDLSLEMVEPKVG